MRQYRKYRQGADSHHCAALQVSCLTKLGKQKGQNSETKSKKLVDYSAILLV